MQKEEAICQMVVHATLCNTMSFLPYLFEKNIGIAAQEKNVIFKEAISKLWVFLQMTGPLFSKVLADRLCVTLFKSGGQVSLQKPFFFGQG